jgi:hypothetical protein
MTGGYVVTNQANGMQMYKEITVENPILTVWRSLRNYLDIDFTSEKIRSIHGLSDKIERKNVQKQATQIGYCIKQAQEYFHASTSVGLPTKPLLLYYGATSLSTALVLLKNDGKYSLDALRTKNEHQHHGLDFQRGLPNRDYLSTGISNFFSSLKCTCHIKNDKPSGLFGLFYQSLVPSCFAIDTEVHDKSKTSYLKSHQLLLCSDMLDINNIIRKNFGLLELIKYLPDVYSTMCDAGIDTYICKGGIKRKITKVYKKDNQGNEQLDDEIVDTDFFIDGVNEGTKNRLLKFYGEKNANIKTITDYGQNLHLKLTYQSKDDIGAGFYVPDAVENLAGTHFYILNPQDYLHEPVSYFILLYCLGMLARYYPDLWMYVQGKNIRIAEFTDSLLDIIYRKFPNLILDQMTLTKHYIHI